MPRPHLHPRPRAGEDVRRMLSLCCCHEEVCRALTCIAAAEQALKKNGQASAREEAGGRKEAGDHDPTVDAVRPVDRGGQYQRRLAAALPHIAWRCAAEADPAALKRWNQWRWPCGGCSRRRGCLQRGGG